MRFHDVFDDRQTQPRSSQLLRTRFVLPEKPLENASLGFFGDPDPRILDRDRHTFRLLIGGQDDPASGSIKFDGVVDEVHEDLMDLVPVAGYDQGLP